MKRSTIRYVLIMAVISIVGIIVMQVYWVTRAFDIREKQFNQNVNNGLRSVAEHLMKYNKNPVPLINPVEQLTDAYFVVMVNDKIDPNLLETLLRFEFHKRSIMEDFEYGIYDCVSEKIVFGNYVNLDNIKNEETKHLDLPKWEDNDYYFGVYFPNKSTDLIGHMGFWGFSSVVFLIVVLFFIYTLYIILKQRRLSEIQKQFINNMTHEFRTPISTIQISSGVLQDPDISNTPDRLINYAKIIGEESKRLLGQVDRILQMAMLDKADLKLIMEPVDAHTVIQNIINRFSAIFPNASFVLDLKAEKHILSADEFHFSNIFFNLMDNAIKYSGDSPEVVIRTKNEGDTLEIEIKDNGIGIAKEHQKKIFDRFYRVPTGDVHNTKGFGIGLSYVKTLVHAHKATIRLESQPGQGSSFIIRFKLPN